MDALETLAARLATPSPPRVVGGTVVEVMAGHVRVDLGDKVVAATWATSLPPATVGMSVRLLVGGGTCEAITCRPPEQTWTPIPLMGGWSNYGGGFASAAYRLVGDAVELRGVIKGGSLNTPLYTLPAGLRPSAGSERFIVRSQPGAAAVEVHWSGDIQVIDYLSSGTKDFVSLSPIRFAIS